MDKLESSEAETEVKQVINSFEAMEVDASSDSASDSKPESTSTYYPKLGRHLHPLTLFIVNPTIVIDTAELEIIVVTRILLYRALERMNKKLYVKPFSSDWIWQLKLEFINLGRSAKSSQLDRAIERACVLIQPEKQSLSNLKPSVWDESCSHFIATMIYCRKDTLKDYLIERELEWFRAKWSVLFLSGIKVFLKNCCFEKVKRPISDAEKNSLKEKLLCSTVGLTEADFESTDFYKLGWVSCSRLLEKREVYIEKGKAYVPTRLLYAFFQNRLKKNLEDKLTYTYKKILELGRMPDDRVSLFCELYDGDLTEKISYTSRSEGLLNGKKIDEEAATNFPLCMQHFHERLREDHHLKHEGRFTYGLFLKEIGLSYEDAEEFWRSEFTQKLDEDRFNKEYLYYIKHLYGLVGGRKSYEPRSCQQLIKGLDQHYGCPFKMYDNERLNKKCISQGFSKEDTQEILDCVENKEYQKACSTYFSVMNNKKPKKLIAHPNQYYEESCKPDNDPFAIDDIEDLC